MKVAATIHELIGNTPLLEITAFRLPEGTRVFAKLEYYNPGGSVKDRLGMELIEEAMRQGHLAPGGTVIEPTAGNTGIGVALACIKYGIKPVFTVPEKFSMEKQKLMQALGAEIITTPTCEGMTGAIRRSEELAETIPGAYVLAQFSNPANPMAYYRTLGPELLGQLGHIDVFVAGAGTGGTFTGVSTYLKEKLLAVKTVIVEPVGSILNGGEAGSHDTEGIGLEFIPAFMEPGQFDAIHTISDQEAFRFVKELALKTGAMVGSSSGAAMAAALKEAAIAPPGSIIVTIFPDSGERYLSKDIYNYGSEGK